MQQDSITIPDSMTTIRDYIRWGASRFTAAGLFFGHGTATAIDDAAAIVLFVLHLPYDLPAEYFAATLTVAERTAVIRLFERRISEKIPSAYLTHETVFAGLSFYVDERVLVPRSPIAELIKTQFSPWLPAAQVRQVLDLCTGSGCIAIACAYAFPDARLTAVDLSADALEVARINVAQHHLAGQVELLQSDLFGELQGKQYDLIISNPPYVCQAEWETLPAEFRAEPELGFKGGESGLDLVIKILAEAINFLQPSGVMVVEVGSSAETLLHKFPGVPFLWLEFDHGGDGVFLLTAEQLLEFNKLFKAALN